MGLKGKEVWAPALQVVCGGPAAQAPVAPKTRLGSRKRTKPHFARRLPTRPSYSLMAFIVQGISESFLDGPRGI